MTDPIEKAIDKINRLWREEAVACRQANMVFNVKVIDNAIREALLEAQRQGRRAASVPGSHDIVAHCEACKGIKSGTGRACRGITITMDAQLQEAEKRGRSKALKDAYVLIGTEPVHNLADAIHALFELMEKEEKEGGGA